MMFAPLEGWRHVKVTDRHTAVDYAHVLKDLADIHFAHAKPSFWSKTISASTVRLHSTKLFQPSKPGGQLGIAHRMNCWNMRSLQPRRSKDLS